MKYHFPLLICLLACALPAQRIYYVNQAVAGGAQTGLDWANAFPGLQAALAAAGAGDTIWVAKGAYLPTGTADRSATFSLKPEVRLYGGFAGTESALDERDWAQNETVLSGDIGEPGVRTDNSYSIVTGQGLDSAACLDGFILRYSYSDGEGGALRLTATAQAPATCPLIRNCRFEYNFADRGAGLNCPWNSAGHINPVLKNCRFQYNAAKRNGGAVYKAGPSPTNHPFVAEDCQFSDNRVGISWNGGGVYFQETMGRTLFLRCQFERDTAFNGLGGALYYSAPLGPAEMILDSCRFIKNYASDGAGILYDEFLLSTNGVDSYVSYFKNCIFEQNYTLNGVGSAFHFISFRQSFMRLYIERCQFLNNAESASAGNCIFEAGEDSDILLSVRNSKFIGNVNADPGSDRSFAMKYGSYIYYTPTRCRAYFDNCIFARNAAGIQAFGNNVNTYITNCTFFKNQKYILEKTWKPEFNDSTLYNNMYVSNCIFWEKSPSYWLFSDGSDFTWEPGGYHVDYVMLNQPKEGFLTGQIGPHAQYKVYPMFVDTAADDFRLLPCSPAVNFGDNLSVVAAGLSTDLDGQPRIFGDTVDLGAYEAQDTCNTVPAAEAPAELAAALAVYPNPAVAGGRARVYVGAAAAMPLRWELRDAPGRLVAAGRATGEVFEIGAPPSPGLYYLSVQGRYGRAAVAWALR